jgi:hypothetical protein
LLAALKLVGNFMLELVVAAPGAGNVVRSSVRSILIPRQAIRPLPPKRIMGNAVALSQDLTRLIIVVEGIIVIVRSDGNV